MKRNIITVLCFAAISATTLTSCFKEDFGGMPITNGPLKISLSGEISQIYQTRVNDQGFCNGDAVGIYVVDYIGTTPGSLNEVGNRADNIKHTFDEQNYKWNSSKDIYWKDNKTNVDIYGYYPYGSPQSATAYSFEVQKDQSTSAAYGKIGGYEASDFLWGKAENVAPTDQVIKLAFRHMMASVRVTLAEGSGFVAGEWAALEKSVLVLNTKKSATIDLKTGNVTSTGEVAQSGIIPMKDNGDFRAIVVPQEIPTGKSLISVTVGGTPYLLARNESFIYVASKQHNFTITVNKRTPIGLEFMLTAESITAWENDNKSHDSAAREYIVIDVQTPGTLHERIAAAGKDITKVKNLKVTGKINATDFAYMRMRMPILQALNLSEVSIFAELYGSLDNQGYSGKDNEIPDNAFKDKLSLSRIILPEKIVRIGFNAFRGCSNLIGSIVIPEGVKWIDNQSFLDCSSLNGILVLPSTLEYIGEYSFFNCKFNSELKLPEKLKYIGDNAFNSNNGFYGTLILPDDLEYIGRGAFSNCTYLTGALEIPQKIKSILNNTFAWCGFNGTLKLHNEIISIESGAFTGTKFRGELNLPSELITIKDYAFSGCQFSGNLIIPEGVVMIGAFAFASNSNLTGILRIPSNVQSIGQAAFQSCSGIEGLHFGENLEIISNDAFSNCINITEIICKSIVPPKVYNNAFSGISKDNFTVEVPESSVSQYQTASGWIEFKRISAHRELSVSPRSASAINTSISRDLILRAEGEWIVESKPDWINLDKMSGNNLSQLKVTFQQMATGSANREGDVVFKLLNKDYTTRCKVSQYNYLYGEDQYLTLQSATKGSGVNIVFLGDGYSAKDVSEGKYLNTINEAVGHFFNVEPYKTYKNYFNIYTGIAVSPESGIGGINTIINNKFNTYALGGIMLGPNTALYPGSDRAVFEYAAKAPTVNEDNLSMTLVVIIANTTEYGGVTYMYTDGAAIAYCPTSNYGYPYDFRGLIQHEAGGHGFGKLADEYISHNSFIQYCGCTCHPHIDNLIIAKSLGWFENISLTGKLNEVPWSHFIFHEKYNQIVDVFEGAFYHSRGVYRSEQSSCMNNNIPYFNAISRESIVKRIKKYAGEIYSYDDFLAKDVLDASTVTKTFKIPESLQRTPLHQSAPVMMGRRPMLNNSK